MSRVLDQSLPHGNTVFVSSRLWRFFEFMGKKECFNIYT